MIVYEFWLKEQFRTQAFDALCNGFYNLGNMMNRWDNPKDANGNSVERPSVYAVSRNPQTHWIQLLVDGNTPEVIVTAIENRIKELKGGDPFRKYTDDRDNSAPIETPRHFSLEKVLEIRRKQKDGTLGRIE